MCSVISEESPGHLSQSKGFVEALRKEIDIKVDIVVGKTTLRSDFYIFFFSIIFWNHAIQMYGLYDM